MTFNVCENVVERTDIPHVIRQCTALCVKVVGSRVKQLF